MGASIVLPKKSVAGREPPNKGLQRAAYRGAIQPLWHNETSSGAQQLAAKSATAEPLVRSAAE